MYSNGSRPGIQPPFPTSTRSGIPQANVPCISTSPGIKPPTLTLRGGIILLEQKLGQGSFGEVFKARDVNSGQLFALKKINVLGGNTESLKREVDTLSKFTNHPHVVTLFHFEFYGPNPLLLMEFCSGGNLNSRLAKPGITDALKLRWMSELAAVIRSLHSKGIVHRDLKPENILLTWTDSIKLGDFGLARQYTALKQGGGASDQAYVSYMNQIGGGASGSYTSLYMGSCLGTTLWMAPEVFICHYTEKADIFSLGGIFYSIETLSHFTNPQGEKHFAGLVTDSSGGMYGFGQALSMNLQLPFGNIPPGSRRDLIQGMLCYDPKQRPSAEQVYNAIERIKYEETLSLATHLQLC